MRKEQLEDIKKLEPSNPIYQHAFRTLFGRKEKFRMQSFVLGDC